MPGHDGPRPNTPPWRRPPRWSARARGSASILPSRRAKSLRSCAERHDKISCSLRNRRGISSSYSALPFRVRRSRNSRRSSAFSTRSTICRFHQRGNGAADGGFVGAGAMRDVLRAAGIVAEAERRQHAPFRNVEPVARLIFDRKRGTDLGRQPVQPERHELEEIQPGVFRCDARSSFARTGQAASLEDAFGKIAPI